MIFTIFRKALQFFTLLFIVTNICFAVQVHNFISPEINKEFEGVPVWSMVQDNSGFIWIASHSGVYKYDSYNLLNTPLKINENLNFGIRVNSLHVDNSGVIWASTNNNGIFYLKNEYFHQYKLDTNHNKLKFKSITEDENHLWFASRSGIIKVFKDANQSQSQKYEFIESPKNSMINSVVLYQKNLVLVGTSKGVFRIKTSNNKYEDGYFHNKLKNKIIQSLHIDSNGLLWIGANSGLYTINKKNELKQIINDYRIQIINSDKNNIWAGSVYDGLFRINPTTHNFEHYVNDLSLPDSLTDNTIHTLFVSDNNLLWVGTFHNGISLLKINSIEFKLFNHSKESISCSKSSVFSSQLIDDNIWWLGTTNGLIKYDQTSGDCKHLISDSNDSTSLSHNMINNLDKGKNNELWVSTGTRLNRVNIDTLEVDQLSETSPQAVTYFSIEINQNERLVGTSNGLFKYNSNSDSFKKIIFSEKKQSKIYFYDVKKNSKGEFFFGTSIGLVKLNKNGVLENFRIKSMPSSNIIYTLYIDNEDGFWFGLDKLGLYNLDKYGNIKFIYNSDQLKLNKPAFIMSIESDSNNNLWLGTEIGLLRLNTETKEIILFNKSDGLHGNSITHKSSFKTSDGNLFFGGQHGFVTFNPTKINLNNSIPNIILTDFSYFNKTLHSWDSNSSTFKLSMPLNELEQIELSYKDYIIGLEFSALDYADPLRNKYAYRLKGFTDDWVYTNANDRKATYTNLRPGEYTFQVKAANKNGVWSETPTELKIKVYPAPWLSPWAFFAYFVIAIFSIWAFIRYKTIASRRRAEHLEGTVKQRTQELNQKNKMVESLLDHKNEVFSNVTHEFKTPLALILGPIQQLLERAQNSRDKEDLSMVQRSAKRLLLMVGQILKLSQAELDKEVIRESQAIHPTLTMLYESFKPLAEDKNIEISFENNNQVNVYATSDCLEIVIGNLISNAIKYTNTGGKISIKSTLNDKYISVHVADTGSGIDTHDLDKIFKRFTRLDSHKSIQGTGIGLSVVKEITEANDGQVRVNSELGKGSEFVVTFPVTDIDANIELSQELVDQLVSNTDNELIAENTGFIVDSIRDENKVTVLSIEDNLDMQTHIGNVLKGRFNCLFADRGKKGIALALEEVPDIIICDVMMPGMDGYQVTRILRHDARTSHIPIILLTALNTKESRIKGWRENIDVYVTKPFDATELNVQIDNILTIRQLLQKKTNKAFKSNDSFAALELPEQDLVFIEKLKDVIAQYYTNEYFQKADIASKMAVSERQLNRKVKALIDENPMDMLRDYRLSQAALILKTGKQVGIVSDECGFSAVAYFSTCFKKKYGVTPKQYQTLDKSK